MLPIGRLLLRHRGVIASTVISAAAFVLAWLLVLAEMSVGPIATDWPTFAVFTLLLFWCERTPAAWIRFGTAGLVTPISMFSFALMLIGSPSLAAGVALIGAVLHAAVRTDTPGRTLLRFAGTTVSISAAGLMLVGLGAAGSVATSNVLPWNTALGILAAGVTIIVLDTLVAAVSMSVRRQIRFLSVMQRGLAMRITAEGALLSLAPIWAIGLHFGLVLVPLLGITTMLVFRSTRRALERTHDSNHDGLTGLVNRRSFLESLDESLVHRGQRLRPAVLVMDLDGFKDINDRLGHQLGDSLLVSFADRLAQSIPPDAVAGRFGGDEFAVLLPDAGDELPKLIGQLSEQLHAPLSVENFPVTVGVSIGVAQAPEDGHTAQDLLKAADVAMYRSKRTGTRFELYASCVKGPQRGRLNLLGELDQALRNHELHIHFQPQLRIADGQVDTVEALIRWTHPEHGIIPPDEFIGLAEQTDLIVPITELVLRVATRGLMNSGVTSTLAVNVSPRNLQDPGFADQVMRVLRETGFRADRLELEVTERSLVSNAERCKYTIDRLRTNGVRIAIDDFGVGYSGFQALRILDVDRLKIDRDFVLGILDNPRDRLIVASIVSLAHDLGLDVVAEGVENTALWNALGELGCDVAQGYGIAAPMGYPELRGWLSSWSEITTPEVVSAVLHTPTLPDRTARPVSPIAGF